MSPRWTGATRADGISAARAVEVVVLELQPKTLIAAGSNKKVKIEDIFRMN
jgi:hypothetical protein